MEVHVKFIGVPGAVKAVGQKEVTAQLDYAYRSKTKSESVPCCWIPTPTRPTHHNESRPKSRTNFCLK